MGRRGILWIGVNTFLPKDNAGEVATKIELIRSTEEEKGGADSERAGVRGGAECAGGGQLARAAEHGAGAEECVRAVGGAVKYNSLGQISHALYEVRVGVSSQHVRR